MGVAIRLGRRPSEVLRWSMLEVALVAAYCEVEVEQINRTTPSAPPAPGSQQQRLVFYAAPKEKKP